MEGMVPQREIDAGLGSDDWADIVHAAATADVFSEALEMIVDQEQLRLKEAVHVLSTLFPPEVRDVKISDLLDGKPPPKPLSEDARRRLLWLLAETDLIKESVETSDDLSKSGGKRRSGSEEVGPPGGRKEEEDEEDNESVDEVEDEDDDDEVEDEDEEVSDDDVEEA